MFSIQFLTCFSAICEFYYLALYKLQALAENPGVWNLFLGYFFFYAQQQKKGFQIQLFKTWVLTKPDFENTKKKSISNLKKTISGLL